MYLDILNENMVGYANISARDMLDHLFETYGSITSVDLEINFEHMRRAWDPQQPVETLFKQIQDCADYSEAGGVPICPSHQINVGYAQIFATGHFMSACRRWNEKLATEKAWTHFKSHFVAAHRQHKKMQGETSARAVFHSDSAAMTHNEDQMAEATIGAFVNLATATAADRGVVSALTQADSRLVKQLEETTSKLRELKALFHQERRENGAQEVSTYLQAITVGLTVTRLARLTQVSLETLTTLATKRKPLGLITWAEAKPTRNDVLGRQL
jgi:hypothetical protein